MPPSAVQLSRLPKHATGLSSWQGNFFASKRQLFGSLASLLDVASLASDAASAGAFSTGRHFAAPLTTAHARPSLHVLFG